MLCLASLLLFSSNASHAHKNHNEPEKAVVLAPGYHSLEFDAPAVASYELPVLYKAIDAALLDENKQSLYLSGLLEDKYILLSFIYTSCNDVNGCPLATYVLSQVQKKIQQDDLLKDTVRLISISFDPQTDTPAVMKKYGQQFNPDNFDWRFLTAQSDQALASLLQSYDQSISREIDENGNHLGNISHILRVFLLDRDGFVRNIYSVSFLHADTIINDIKTLHLAQKGRRKNNHAPKPALDRSSLKRHGAGDDKSDYEYSHYTTQSKSLDQRKGSAIELTKLIQEPPLGLDKPASPPDNPVTQDKVALGKKLFFDRRLSHNNTFSCAMCHIPEQGFSNHEIATAIGVEGRTVRRNAPTLYNVVYAKRLFHDAREFTLEQQIWSPLLAHNEMANPSVGYVLNKLGQQHDYQAAFTKVFPGKGLNMETLGMALASYQRTLLSGNSPFDRWYYGKEEAAITAEARRGYELFTGKAHCVRCHSIGKRTAMFTDNQLHNTGIGYRASMYKPAKKQTVQLAPGVFVNIDKARIPQTNETRINDLGYYEISGDPADRWKYRTPTLRNIALTAPYMHNGSINTLEELIAFYQQGGHANPLLDPLMQAIDLDDDEVTSLLAFLNSLTGDNIDSLVGDAFAQPVGNIE